MSKNNTHMVTGAFGFSGKYIAKKLLEQGHTVATITNSEHKKNSLNGNLDVHPLSFDQPDKLTSILEGTEVLYNTYWVRFNHERFTHSMAVENTLTLFDCAKKAGVKKIVHVSITNPAEDSGLEYFRDKARLEDALINSGISYSILRPAVIFGAEDILMNNIAWMLRRFLVFGVFGDGKYKIQPIYCEDLAELAVKEGQTNENAIINAIGPETFTYKELAKEIGRLIGKPRPIISIPPLAGFIIAKAMGLFVGDTVLTKEEIKGLMQGRLAVDAPPTGTTKFTDWVKDNAENFGKKYANELQRR